MTDAALRDRVLKFLEVLRPFEPCETEQDASKRLVEAISGALRSGVSEDDVAQMVNTFSTGTAPKITGADLYPLLLFLRVGGGHS